HVADFRAHGGRITQGPLEGANVLLLTSTGVKSGEPRLTPLGYTRDGDRWVVVGSNSGHAHDPAWGRQYPLRAAGRRRGRDRDVPRDRPGHDRRGAPAAVGRPQ